MGTRLKVEFVGARNPEARKLCDCNGSLWIEDDFNKYKMQYYQHEFSVMIQDQAQVNFI